MTFALYCLSVFFAFHLLNHSDLLAAPRAWLFPRLARPFAYMVQCAFCTTFWVTLVLCSSGRAPWQWLAAAPVVNLFALKLYHYLTLRDN